MFTWCLLRTDGPTSPQLLLALVIRPLATHPCPDGAPFLLLQETAPTYVGLSHFHHILHENNVTYLGGWGGGEERASWCVLRCPRAINMGFVFEPTRRY